GRFAPAHTQPVDCQCLARERSAPMQRPVAPPPATFQIVLPLPPGVNNQYVSVGRRRMLSASAKTFNRDVAKLIAAERSSGRLSTTTERALAEALLGVYLVLFFETP